MLRRGDVSKKFCQAARDSEPVPDPVSFRAGDRCHWREDPPDERYGGTTSLAPRIYEGGGPRSGRGSSPAAAGKASSVTASPCQLPQRGSRGSCAPFLPPSFMRGEGHAVAGGVPPAAGGDGPLSHASPCRLSRRESQGAMVVPQSRNICCFIKVPGNGSLALISLP